MKVADIPPLTAFDPGASIASALDDLLCPRPPRWGRFWEFAGGWSAGLLLGLEWIGIPQGPHTRPLAWLRGKALRASSMRTFAEMPVGVRLVVGASVGLASLAFREVMKRI